MLRKIGRNLAALLIVCMTVIGMLGMNITSIEAADYTYSVDINNVAYNKVTRNYTIVDPVIKVPATTNLTYMTINVRNGYFNSASAQDCGTHHYNAGGSDVSAYADLIVFNSTFFTSDTTTTTAQKIERILESLVFHRDENRYTGNYNVSEDKSGVELQIEVEISKNAINLPNSDTYNYNYYKNTTTGKTYLYVSYKDTTSTTGTTWHDAYNTAKTLEFSNMKGYLAADTEGSTFTNCLLRAGGYLEGWVGMTSLYNVTSEAASSTYNASTWLKISDSDSIALTPTNGKYASKQMKSSNSMSADLTETKLTGTSLNDSVTVNDTNYWDSQKSGSTTTLSREAALKNVTNFYIADGPNKGAESASLGDWGIGYHSVLIYYVDYVNTDGSNHYKIKESYALIHYLPDNNTTTTYTSALARYDSTAKEDCVVYTEGALNDKAEEELVKGFYVEFTPDNYSNAFMTGTSAEYSAGNASNTFNANKNLAADTTKQCTFKTYLLMDTDAAVPTQSFTYYISSVTGPKDTSGNDTTKIFDGIDQLTSTGYVYSTSVSFSYEDNPTYTGTTATQTITSADIDAIKAATGLTSLDNKKFAVSEGVVDFSHVVFHEPGVYRFKISQYNADLRYIKWDSVQDLYLDVYVDASGSVDDDTLTVKNYIFHTSANDTIWQGNGVTASETKRPYYVNEYLTNTLIIKKAVSGNQSRLDQYFKFNISFSGSASNARLGVDFSNKDTILHETSMNYEMYTNGLQSNYYKNIYATTFYLKADDTITIKGVPHGSWYILSEDTTLLNQTGYTAAISSVEGDNSNYYDDSGSKISLYQWDYGLSKDTTITVTNTKNGIIPTGVIIAVAPYATIALGGFFGLIIFAKHKKHKDDEDAEDDNN